MTALLTNPAEAGPERTLIWHYPFNVKVIHPDNGQALSPHSAIRVGDHKLIWDWHGKLELYDIPKDPTESNDLSKEMPEITTKLHNQLKSWLKQNVAPRYFPTRIESVTPAEASRPFPFRDLR
jgi:hypothetical protein